MYQFVQVEYELLLRLMRRERSRPTFAELRLQLQVQEEMGLNHTQCCVEGRGRSLPAGCSARQEVRHDGGDGLEGVEGSVAVHRLVA